MSNATVVFGPVVLVIALLVIAVLGARAYSLRSRRPVNPGEGRAPRSGPTIWVKGLALSVAVAVPTFLTGAIAGFAQVGETCGLEVGRSRADSVRATGFPLSKLCTWDDGMTHDLVPFWVNPVLYLCAAAAAVCVFMALRAAIKNKKELVHD
ncbi:hypothetical protein ACIQU4_03400 [Streptomyces sp. NPDC090741]|uniref:hypothetical protein n=1 Tax=Streptomyces sp. NPDC090741 TaxID=3365967 RepID=UPI00382712D6